MNTFNKFKEEVNAWYDSINYFEGGFWSTVDSDIYSELVDSVKNIRLIHEAMLKRGKCKFEYTRPVVFPKFDSNKNYKLIIVLDNPGDREQFMGEYLVGRARSFGDSFFKKYNLGSLDDVLILNKTSIHTPRTKELRLIDYNLLAESQFEMADLIFKLNNKYDCDVWIMGCSELNGIFEHFKDKINILYEQNIPDNFYLVNHFSYNSLLRHFNNYDGSFNDILNELSLKLKLKYEFI